MRGRRILPGLMLAIGMLACAYAPAWCKEELQQPYELMRSLRTLQDRIAVGDSAAFLAYPRTIAAYAALFEEAPEDAWKDPRNVRAAVAFVLSGGDPHVLAKLAKLDTGTEKTLVRAALAYGNNRNTQAAELLADANPRTLDPSIAAHIALVRAELLTKKDPDRALALLADARLLAPGTMIEESALRREATLAADRGDAARFESVMSQYLRRFASSVHMATFRRQFATSIATRGMGDDLQRRSRMETVIGALPPSQREDVYLSVAWEGIMAGRVDLVRWATASATGLSADDSPQQLRARLFAGAVLLVTDEFERGVSQLRALPPDQLDAEEEGLLAAALSVADEVRRASPLPQSADNAPPGASAPAVAAVAKATIAKVDNLLSGVRQ